MTNARRHDRLQAQWDEVPADRQERYRRIYQRELQQAGATTDDAAELAVLQRLITAYQEQALVPVGARWASVPQRVRQAARRGQPLHTINDPGSESTAGKPPRAAILLLIPLAGLLIFALMTFIGGTHDEDTLTASVTATVTHTLTPEISPTPTPLALEDSDSVIEAGETSNRDYFPVLLQVYPSDNAPARVFVVQERAVETADWHFDSNPDVASWVSGLLVRPVLGLPHSEDNEALLNNLAPGARFALQMNTGATLDFIYDDTQQVIRQNTGIFSQTEPGIALILIGEFGDDGLLTDERLVVTGRYPIEQEIDRLQAGELASVIPLQQAATIASTDALQVTVLMTDTVQPDSLPEDLVYALVDLDITSGANPIRTSTLRWLLEDPAGNRYSPDPNAGALASFSPLPGEIPAHTGLQTSLGFLIPRTLTDARLLVSTGNADPTAFALSFSPPPIPATVEDLDVQVRQVQFDATTLYIEARLFNPTDQTISLTASNLWLVTGFAPSPPGSQMMPLTSNLPAAIEATIAVDLSLTFAYSAEPFARLALLGREYALTITGRR